MHTLFSWTLDEASFFGRFIPGEGVNISRWTRSGRGGEGKYYYSRARNLIMMMMWWWWWCDDDDDDDDDDNRNEWSLADILKTKTKCRQMCIYNEIRLPSFFADIFSEIIKKITKKGYRGIADSQTGVPLKCLTANFACFVQTRWSFDPWTLIKWK
jgi:hypothetical protein